jgi:hypothetical protein
VEEVKAPARFLGHDPEVVAVVLVRRGEAGKSSGEKRAEEEPS